MAVAAPIVAEIARRPRATEVTGRRRVAIKATNSPPISARADLEQGKPCMPFWNEAGQHGICDIGMDLHRWFERHGGGGAQSAEIGQAAADQHRLVLEAFIGNGAGQHIARRHRARLDGGNGAGGKTQAAILVQFDQLALELQPCRLPADDRHVSAFCQARGFKPQRRIGIVADDREGLTRRIRASSSPTRNAAAAECAAVCRKLQDASAPLINQRSGTVTGLRTATGGTGRGCSGPPSAIRKPRMTGTPEIACASATLEGSAGSQAVLKMKSTATALAPAFDSLDRRSAVSRPAPGLAWRLLHRFAVDVDDDDLIGLRCRDPLGEGIEKLFPLRIERRSTVEEQ